MLKYVVAGLLALALVAALFLLLKPGDTSGTLDSAAGDVAGAPEATGAPHTCSLRGVLPDAVCTPGAADPAVTQDNLQATICKSGYTKTVRPPASYTNKLKAQQMRDYGYQDANPKDYEEDHLISLELGGAPRDPANLWPEPGASPNPKDKIENQLHALVCAGKMTLADAQHRIATDWTTAVP